MSQKSDDSVEQFFRKAVVQQDKTFMERDWHSMEKMLDARDAALYGQRATRVQRSVKVTALALVIVSLFLVGIESDSAPEFVQVQAAGGMVGPRPKVKTENPTADLHSSTNISQEKTIPTKGIVSKGEKISEDFQSTVQRSRLPSPAAGQTGKRPHEALSTARKTELLESDLSSQSRQESNGIDRNAEIAPLLTAEFTLPSHSNSSQSNSTQSQPLVLSDQTAIAQVERDSMHQTAAQNAAETVEEIENEKSVLSSSRLILTGLISPDFSTTSLAKYSKPSGVFGVLLGYRVSRRFTVMAGVTRSLKKYEGYGNEYTPPEGYWQNRTNGIVPDEVEGQCGIIEVPLMLQFDLVQRLKSRIFVSAGVSSYFMRSENYQYTFHQPNPGAASSWTAKEPTQYLFKIGHLSAGYDRMLTRNLSLGIEPFLKVPFEGIGWTDINLYSTGAYINLRYTILRTHQ